MLRPVHDDTDGTVSSVSVISSNGVSGSVADETTTPAITISATGRLMGFQTRTGSGTYTPTPGATLAYVIAIGGGGGGGGIDGTVGAAGGGTGGGSGGQCHKFFTSLAASYDFACGAGGAGGAGAASGTDGGDTTFGTALLTAHGGKGGLGVEEVIATLVSIPASGNSTTPTGGDLNIPGQSSNAGFTDGASIAVAGNGGSNPYGTGGVGLDISYGGDGNGVAGVGYGAGGGGAGDASSTNRTGGSGTNGAVLIWEYS